MAKASNAKKVEKPDSKSTAKTKAADKTTINPDAETNGTGPHRQAWEDGIGIGNNPTDDDEVDE